MKKILIPLFIAAVGCLFLLAYAGNGKLATAQMDPKAELMKSVERGKVLFMDATLGTSGMSCNSCHPEGGTKEGKMGEKTIMPFDNLAAKYPKYITSAKRVMTLDQMINWCIVKAMKGEALAWDSQKLTDLTAYVASVKAK
ncbi:MAG: hypothetical protein OEX80_09380 [Candidatus Aminicenantes bacterium]|nr:hypothetical protein [Candidatus Aminicenantes bacterium]